MAIDAALLEVLQCPSCRGQLSDGKDVLLCGSCGKRFPVVEGIPDLTYFGLGTEQDDFNRIQATYEAELHDRSAESAYEKQVIRFYGTKTGLVAQNWASRIRKISPPVRVLDYGCGTGQVSCVLGRYFSPLYAVDISAFSLRKNIAENGVLGCIANGLFLPFKDRAFDVVCLNGVLHHIVDLSQAIGEISRVAKSYIFVSDLVPDSLPGLRRMRAYPGLLRKSLYASWAIMWLANRNMRKLIGRVFPESGLAKSVTAKAPSKYERPIASETVESLFRGAGFVREDLQYWTNLRYPGDNLIKRWITKALVNETIGTHFDFVLRRYLRNGAEPRKSAA